VRIKKKTGYQISILIQSILKLRSKKSFYIKIFFSRKTFF